MNRATLLGAALAFAAAPLTAQQVSLRLGGLHARYADSLTGDAGSIGARLTWDRPRARAVLDASYAQFATGGGALQAWGNLAFVRPIGARAILGLRGDGVVNTPSGGLSTGSGTVEGFAAVGRAGWNAVLGVLAGGVRAVDSTTIGTAGLAIRAQRSFKSVTVSASAAGTAASGVRYADATLAVDWRGARFGGGVLAGARTGDLSNAPWLQGYGQMRITPCMSFEAAIGSYPRDLTGFARGFYFNAGMRVTLARGSSAQSMLTREAAPRDVVVETGPADSVRVTFTVADADTVAIVGSWNDWTPAPLTRTAGGRWTIVLPIGTGTWRFALVMADGRWIVPASVTSLPDDFGGQVGVLVLRR